MKRNIYLIDASIYVFRAWFSMPDSIVNRNGEPVNAVYGYAYFLCQLLEKTQVTHIAAAFDESLSTSFRNKIYPDYKSNREKAPDDLKYQFMLCKKLTEILGVSTYSSKRYEADDLIGTLASKVKHAGFNTTFVTCDKDLSQLLRKGDRFWNYAKDEMHSYKDCKNRFGVMPEKMIDFLALAGDSVDNIPGVAGVGSKTAIALLDEYGSLKNIYKQLGKIKSSKLRGAQRIHDLLEQHRDLAFVSQKLATIVTNAPLQAGLRKLSYSSPSTMRINRFCNQYGLGDKLRRRLLNFSQHITEC